MYGADGVFAPGSVAGAADARDPAHVAEGFSVAQAAFDLRVDALLVWSELDAEIFPPE